MWELRFVGIHDEGEHVVVCSPDLDDEEFLLPITDELRDALAPPARSRPPEPVPDQPLTPRDIQSRIRAGESPDELSRAAGVPLAKIERFAGPVLSERAHVVDEARAARLNSSSSSEPGPLGDVVTARLDAEGVALDTVGWDAWRRDDGNWTVQVSYLADGARQTAEWSWDPARRQVRPYGAAARALSTVSQPAAEPTQEPRAQHAGLRMVPRAVAPVTRPAPAQIDIREPAGGEAAAPRPTRDESADGVTKRAAVPSWDDILFGVRRDH